MTNHRGPESPRNVKAEDRCQAEVPPNKSIIGWPAWQQVNRQCCRRGQGSRAGRIACWQHLQLEDVKWVDEPNIKTNTGEG